MLSEACEQLVFEEYLEATYSLERHRKSLDDAITKRSLEPDLAKTVAALSCVRGISTLTAFSMASEIADFTRFFMLASLCHMLD